jgi:hypothetical protein
MRGQNRTRSVTLDGARSLTAPDSQIAELADDIMEFDFVDPMLIGA